MIKKGQPLMMDSKEKPRYFLLPKKAESAESCQDAGDINLQRGRYAIADGATRSFFPKEWARLLVARFCHDDDPLNTKLFDHQEWPRWLQPVQEKWKEEIKKIVASLPAKKYYVKNRYAKKDPAAATFVGVQISASREGYEWQSMIIGDSCLFVVRANRLEKSYLIERSQEFGSHPESFASMPRYNKYEPRFINGTAKEGDVLILATDALAKWILMHHEKGSWAKAWHVLHQITTEDDFTALIDAARENREIPPKGKSDTVKKTASTPGPSPNTSFVSTSVGGRASGWGVGARSDVRLVPFGEIPLENDDVTLMIIPIGLKKKPLGSSSIKELAPPQKQVHKKALPLTSSDSPRPVQKPRESSKAPPQRQRTTVNLWPRIALVLSGLLFLSIGVNYLFYNRLPEGTLNPFVTEAPITIFLPAGTQIYSPESDSASPVLTITQQTEASLLSKAESESQVDIQIELWVISERNGIVYATEKDNRIYIEHEAEVYQLKQDTKQLVEVGRVAQDVWLLKTGEIREYTEATFNKVSIDGVYAGIDEISESEE